VYRAGVQAWLDRYVDAWQQNEPGPIEALFTQDATYAFAPFGEDNIARGHAEILKAWLDNPDPPGTWEAHYEPFTVSGDRAVAIGWSRYFTDASKATVQNLWDNVYLLEFGPDGRCSSFTEYFVERPKDRS